MAKTNKALLKAGLSQEEIMELVEAYLTNELDFQGIDFANLVHDVEVGGDEYELTIYCNDTLNRTYVIGFEYERPETITFASMKGDEDRDEQNVKEFKSITGLMNHIVRMNKNA